jgi:hypothetical protein
VKTDEQIFVAITRAHHREREFVDRLTDVGVVANARSSGFRASLANIIDYAHDIDFEVEGYTCQYKYRTSYLWILQKHRKRPFVDEKVKADRTPVDFYILRFSDTVIVAPYEPEAWDVEWTWDPSERVTKQFYTVDPNTCIPLDTWLEAYLEVA